MCLIMYKVSWMTPKMLHFDDKTLINVITDCHATGTGSSITETNKSVREHYRLKCKWHFFAKGDFPSEVKWIVPNSDPCQIITPLVLVGLGMGITPVKSIEDQEAKLCRKFQCNSAAQQQPCASAILGWKQLGTPLDSSCRYRKYQLLFKKTCIKAEIQLERWNTITCNH